MIVPKLIGGLGNQAFILATAYAYSLKHKIQCCFPSRTIDPSQWACAFPELAKCEEEEIKQVFLLKENSFHYHHLPSPPKHTDIILEGYYQSARYFDEYRPHVLKLFKVQYKYKEGVVCVHIRRGDYLKYPNHHPVVDLDYIHAAIKYFQDKGYEKFLILSDDQDWCYDNIQQIGGYEYEFSEGRTAREDLALGSSCQHMIGSNSSYSWWLYYLNQNEDKIGIFPTKDKWFGKELPHNVDDLYNSKWVLL